MFCYGLVLTLGLLDRCASHLQTPEISAGFHHTCPMKIKRSSGRSRPDDDSQVSQKVCRYLCVFNRAATSAQRGEGATLKTFINIDKRLFDGFHKRRKRAVVLSDFRPTTASRQPRRRRINEARERFTSRLIKRDTLDVANWSAGWAVEEEEKILWFQRCC